MNRRAFLIALPLALGSVTGCRTPGATGPALAEVVTPQRVQAVVTWGAYAWLRSAPVPQREAVRRALPALRRLAESTDLDLPTVAAALQEAGITFLSTPEGTLAVATALTFSDLWHQSVGHVSQSTHVRAVLAGVVAGCDLAFSGTRSVGTLGDASAMVTEQALRDAAIAAR